MDSSAALRAANDPRLSCVLCEDALPPVAMASATDSLAGICARCWALTPDDRRVLRGLAMTRILRRDLKS